MGGVKFVQQDHQGSVRTITNANGFVVSRTDHQAFGETIGSGIGLRNVDRGYGVDPSTRQGYGLTENDESSGQQHTWFRKLETQAGRFSSPDPYKGSMSLGDPQSFDRYSYLNNQPTNYVDPSGLVPPICHAQADGTYWCTGGCGSGGGSFNYNPNAPGGGYYGANQGYGGGGTPIRITTEFGWVNDKRRYSFTSSIFLSFFGGYQGRGGTSSPPAPDDQTDCDKLVNYLASTPEKFREELAARLKIGGEFGGAAKAIFDANVKYEVSGFRQSLTAGGQQSDVLRHELAVGASYLLDGMGLAAGGDNIRQGLGGWWDGGARNAERNASRAGNSAGLGVGALVAARIRNAITSIALEDKLKSILCQ